jgi:hypothetical protein
VAQRDGQEWAQELGHYPGLEQLTRDAGTALKKGLAVVNAQRQQQHQSPIADQEDHFHIFREGTKALQKMRHRAARLLTKTGRYGGLGQGAWGVGSSLACEQFSGRRQQCGPHAASTSSADDTRLAGFEAAVLELSGLPDREAEEEIAV